METLEAMTPDSKRKAEAYTPRSKKVFVEVFYLHEFFPCLFTVARKCHRKNKNKSMFDVQKKMMSKVFHSTSKNAFWRYPLRIEDYYYGSNILSLVATF